MSGARNKIKYKIKFLTIILKSRSRKKYSVLSKKKKEIQ